MLMNCAGDIAPGLDSAFLLHVQVVASVAMVGVQVTRPLAEAPAVLDAFEDPVSRGVYGPWHPVIRSNANQAFLRWAHGRRSFVSLTASKGPCSHAVYRWPPRACSLLA